MIGEMVSINKTNVIEVASKGNNDVTNREPNNGYASFLLAGSTLVALLRALYL